MALGEVIIEDKGKITGQRVLDVEGPIANVVESVIIQHLLLILL
jgi:hypothetical protein